MAVYIPVVGNHFSETRPISGEYVVLSTEPDNPVDPDAIQVVNLDGQKMGYVPKMQTSEHRQYIGMIGRIFPYKRGYRIKMTPY